MLLTGDSANAGLYITMPDPLHIEETGDLCCYFVSSETDPKHKTYLVDLLDNGGIGSCTCPHFRAKVGPAIRDGLLTLEMAMPDKHIDACRKRFMRQVLQRMAQERGGRRA